LFGETEVIAFMADDVPVTFFQERGRDGGFCGIDLEISCISLGFKVDFP